MILTWWEVEELEEHFHGRPDIWTWDDGSKCWLRTNTDGDPMLGLQILGPNATGPYRKYMLKWVPLNWDDSQCADYITRLCEKWTSYGFRLAVKEFLCEDDAIKMDPKLADAASVHISKMEQEPAPDPEKLALPTQGEIWPDMAGYRPEQMLIERTVRMVGLVGGGWLSIRYEGEMLRVRLSISSAATGGYDHPFEGYIRPRDGNIPMAAWALFNLDITPSKGVTDAANVETDVHLPTDSGQGPAEGDHQRADAGHADIGDEDAHSDGAVVEHPQQDPGPRGTE
jgi:hypothetical protein